MQREEKGKGRRKKGRIKVKKKRVEKGEGEEGGRWDALPVEPLPSGGSRVT